MVGQESRIRVLEKKTVEFHLVVKPPTVLKVLVRLGPVGFGKPSTDPSTLTDSRWTPSSQSQKHMFPQSQPFPILEQPFLFGYSRYEL